MKHRLFVVIGLAALVGVREVQAAGQVIHIGAANGQYTIGGGRTDVAGFADRVFFEPGDEGTPLATHVTGFGTAYRWDTPGVRMDGLLNNSGLYLEALVRPDNTASPARDRALWYWNPTSGQIEEAPEDNHFALYKTWVSATSSIFLSNSTTEPESRFRVAGPVAADMGFDSYGTYLRFALHRIVEPPVGVYGVFARFSSDFYPPSDPFLLLFNNGGLSAAQMLAGAQAINAAADEASDLPGDFNHDGTVDAADYTVWRNGLGGMYDQSDYVDWKNHFGESSGSGGQSAASVPEPAGIASLVALVAIWLPIAFGRTRVLAP